MLRSFMERRLRNVVIRRRLPREFDCRSIYLSPDSALQYLKPNWAKASRELLRAVSRFIKTGSQVWDIGGNLGVFALAAAHRAGPGGQVLALEPDPFLAAALQRSARHSDNEDLRLTVLCAAVSDTIGIARFMVASRGRSSNSLEVVGQRSQAGGVRYTQPVCTVTLDSLLPEFGCPHFIKIDVEGAEARVLAGAEDILAKCRPSFYVEVGDEQKDAVAGVFRRHKYRLFDGDAEDGQELEACAWNTLAVPSESGLTNRGCE